MGKIDLRGRVALVTGGAKGIGLATARRLVDAGVHVVLWDLDTEALREAAQALMDAGGSVRADTVDIANRDAVVQAAGRCFAHEGVVDIVINNAGFVRGGAFLDQPLGVWDTTLAVNVNGLMYVTAVFLPEMYRRNRGHVVNISSAAGLLGVANLAVYSAAKFAVLGLTESLRHEAIRQGKRGVRFSSIHPSFLRSGMFEGARIPGVGGLLVPLVKNHDVIARAIVDSALRRKRRVVYRPRTVRLAPLLRGILPYGLFLAVVRALGITESMTTWKGHDE